MSNPRRKSRSKRFKRPPPPPSPPESLVKLIKQDESVLKYFQSLQDNLEADVQVWKDRAVKLKKENEQLQKKIALPRAAPGKKQSTATQQNKRQSAIATNKINKATTKRKRTSAAHEGENGKRTKASLVKKNGTVSGSNSSTSSARQHSAETNGEASVSQKNGGNKQPSKEGGVVDNIAPFEIASSSDDESSIRQPTRDTEYPTGEVPIDDGMFELILGCDDEGDDLDVSAAKRNVTRAVEVDLLDEEALEKEQARKNRSETFRLLQMAYLSFQQLGVNLVDPEGSSPSVYKESSLADRNGEDDESSTESTEDETFFNCSLEPRKASFIPRSNEDVVMDIVRGIKNLTRLYEKETGGEESENEKLPIDKTTLAPRWNVILKNDLARPLHPMVEGKQMLFRALVLVDTFCSFFLSDDEWDSYFDECSTHGVFHTEEMRIGLRGRKDLVVKLIRSWELEITSLWAQQDRAKRHTATVLHFSGGGTASSNDVEESGLIGGPRSLHWISNVAERCLISQLVIAFYLARNDVTSACRVVMNYLLSTIPSFGVESYPKLPPVLSLCILESMLWLDRELFFGDSSEDESWFIKAWEDRTTHDVGPDSLILQALSFVCRGLASILLDRMASTDDRIHDVALVEYKCFKRMFATLSRRGTDGTRNLNADHIIKECNELERLLLDKCRVDGESVDESLASTWVLQIALLLQGDEAAQKVC